MNLFFFEAILIRQNNNSDNTIIRKNGCAEKPKIFTMNKQQQKI